MGGAARSVDCLCLVRKQEGTSGLRSYTPHARAAKFAIHTMGHLPLQQCLVYESLVDRPSHEDIEADEFRFEYFVSNGTNGMMANGCVDAAEHETSSWKFRNCCCALQKFAPRELCGYVLAPPSAL